jgi:hypothetical protein
MVVVVNAAVGVCKGGWGLRSHLCFRQSHPPVLYSVEATSRVEAGGLGPLLGHGYLVPLQAASVHKLEALALPDGQLLHLVQSQ